MLLILVLVSLGVKAAIQKPKNGSTFEYNPADPNLVQFMKDSSGNYNDKFDYIRHEVPVMPRLQKIPLNKIVGTR